jgi:hypothetical protein
MKIVCIDTNTTDVVERLYSFTVGKFYDVHSEERDNFYIFDDTKGYCVVRLNDTTGRRKFLSIEEYREFQINKIL